MKIRSGFVSNSSSSSFVIVGERIDIDHLHGQVNPHMIDYESGNEGAVIVALKPDMIDYIIKNRDKFINNEFMNVQRFADDTIEIELKNYTGKLSIRGGTMDDTWFANAKDLESFYEE